MKNEFIKKYTQLEAIFQSLGDGLVVLDMKGQILLANETHCKILGFEPQYWHQKNIGSFAELFEVFDLDGRPIPRSELASSRVLRGESVKNLEVHAKRKDTGQEFYFSFGGEPVRNSQGEQYMAALVLRDISEKRNADKCLRDAMKRLTDLKFALDQSSIVAITDAQGIITEVNENFCAISGYSREELIGNTHRIINSNFHSREFFKNIWDTISSGKIWRGEIQNRSKSGNFYWVDTFIVPFIDDEGKPYQYMAIRSDITESKRVEKERTQLMASEQAARESAQIKSQFLANISHEIRTPLNSILGMTEILLDTTLSDEQKEFTRVIQSSTEVLRNLINDILDFSKIESGKLELEKVHFSLAEIIFNTERELRWMAKKKNIKLIVDNSLEIPKSLIGDPIRIRQIITNLLSNGIKFTEQGSVTLRTKIKKDLGDKSQIRVEIEDTGIGLPEKAVSKLFEPFVQSDSSTTRKYGGTGLGLSICKKLVESMNGEIGVESSPGQGSKFWFEVTLDKANSEYNAIAPSPTDGENMIRKDAKILVVEDTLGNQKVTSLLLSKIGFKADIACSGLEALDAIEKYTYDLILMDCHMPEMDGYTATQIIRKNPDPIRSRVPIIAITASAMIGDREKCLDAGMNDYLAKPVSKENMVRCFTKWLRKEEAPVAVDWNAIKQLRSLNTGNNSDIVFELIGILNKSFSSRIELLEKATTDQDVLTILKESHGLKSSTSYLGAIEIGRLCIQIDTLAQQRSFEEIKNLSSKLKNEYQNLVTMLTSSEL